MVHSVLMVFVLFVAWPDQSTDDQWSYDVENAARSYRIQVYNSFRKHRPQFDQLQEAGVRAVEAWKMRGRQPQEAQQVIDWFGQATQAAQAGQASLPESPDFVASWNPSEQQSAPRTSTASQPGHFPHGQPSSIGQGTRGAADRPGSAEPAETRDPSIVRGLGRALLRTVGVGADNPTAGPGTTNSGSGNRTFDVPSAGANHPATFPAPSTPEPEIDLDDLKARVDGFNPAMAAVNRILQGDDPVSHDQLGILTEELETLVQNYNDLQPYLTLEGLSPSDRAYVGQLASPEAAVDQLVKRIAAATEELQSMPDSGDKQQRQEDQSYLTSLLERVNRLSVAPQS